jgi:predicted N-acetyltransferase YhbS
VSASASRRASTAGEGSSAPGASYELREARADDFEGLAALAAASADTGQIRVAVRYLRNPVEAKAALRPEVQWVVAEAGGELIGSGQVVLQEAEVEGELRPCATLGSLMVHPAHRRRGVATALTRWRLDLAGPETVVVAGIQAGNKGSFANANKWATQILGTLSLPGFKVTPDASTPRGLEIREPSGDAEWDEVAEGRAAFEQGWNLRVPLSGAELSERAGRTFEGEKLRRYFVAVEGGRIAGGLELFEGARIEALSFEHVPIALRAVNVFMRVFPRDGDLRPSSISAFWYRLGREDVGRALWAHARYAASGSGNVIGLQFDPRSPVAGLVRVRPWTPKAQLTLAVRSPVRLSEERLLAAP